MKNDRLSTIYSLKLWIVYRFVDKNVKIRKNKKEGISDALVQKLKDTGILHNNKKQLDDIFDKLDAQRVEKIVELVAGDDFGQIFITDTNREHLDSILHRSVHDYQIFYVENGEISNTPPTKEQ